MNDQALSQFLIFGLLFAFMGFILWRGRQRQKAQAEMQNSVAAGTQVMLTSGIFGSVVNVDGDEAQLQVADGVVLTVHRGAIGKVVSAPTTAPPSTDPPTSDPLMTDHQADDRPTEQ